MGKQISGEIVTSTRSSSYKVATAIDIPRKNSHYLEKHVKIDKKHEYYLKLMAMVQSVNK